MASPEAELKKKEMEKNPGKRGYFFTKRNFSEGLVPKEFHRTKAPRLATFGSTFYGMKKSLKYAIIPEITKRYQCTIVDFDFSGAHANIATRFQDSSETLLKQCVKSPHFWDERVEHSMPKVQSLDFPMTQKACRASLKIMLYTSLNGGNPFSPDRVFDNLSNTMPEHLALLDPEVPFEKS
jgi:hypothetical protein